MILEAPCNRSATLSIEVIKEWISSLSNGG
jgi:hypothetical protein